MVSARLSALADEHLMPRVGPEAARTLLRMSQFFPLFIVSTIVMAVTVLSIAPIPNPPLWTVFVGEAAILLYMSSILLLVITRAVRMRKAGRQAYEYLGRPKQCRRGTVPYGVLRDIPTFDSWMVEEGIPQRGDYESLAGPKAYERAARKSAKQQG